MSHILIVEDEAIIRTALRKLLERHRYKVSEAGSVREATTKYRLSDVDLIISDLRLPGAPGTDLLKLAGDVPVLIMTSYASLRSAVDSMRMGAADYIAKPFDHDEMIATVRRVIGKAEQSRAQAPAASKESGRTIAGMIGDSPVMRDLYSRIHKVAPTDATVLVHGETGTGKELVARAIHEESRRATKPLISVNCAAIPETLIEAELFGHEKGAFTGAQTAREGLVAAADGGTLFLDEIGELPLEAQARLLRVLQEGEVRPIGAVESRKVDVRLVAATHRNLRQLAAERKFREDLYYRINVVQMTLAPLRERGKDVLAIAEHLLAKYCAKVERPTLKLSPEAVQAVTTYTWPGNVRELENAIQRAVILTDDNSMEIDHNTLDIDLELVPVEEADPERLPRSRHTDPREDLSLEDYFARFVIEHQDTMSETELAKKLGVSRKCLWERRQKLGIPRKKSRRAATAEA
ncbi:sigma-54-dependent transcriptional regulator [Microbulbifer marinus]|uniref:Two-component response regulator CbrB n=1 Tax=Microbulbifer marinus TaxID=658218 RepID=A0A1H3XCP4_9GAMM|nr:sigma-54 dependent transcriptional regulator [Microbulbifer marinus]SDZ97175.1 Two-component response regulator CbrB [Microbulbifer marinus]